MINQFDLSKHVIEPVLSRMDAWSPEAERLLLVTMLAESVVTANDQRLIQTGGGPALGIYQMEGPTHDDIWKNWLLMRKARYVDAFKEYLPAVVFRQVQSGMVPGSRHMIGNLYYATMMARFHYMRNPERIPKTDELLAEYWKRVWNTHLGAGDPHRLVAKLKQLDGGERVA